MAETSAAGTGMSEGRASATIFRRITADVLATLDRPGLGWLALFSLTLLGLAFGTVAWVYQIKTGLGTAGYEPPVMWAVYITDFVFWVGIAHSGTLISAILFLFRAKFRTSVYRIAETMTVFAVMTAGLFPLIHLGRVWYFYYLIPYPNERLIWPNFRSPLVWDFFAISTYFTISALFLYLGLIPDIAAARDRAAEGTWRRKFYTILSLGWQGTDSQWRHYNRAYLFMAGLATPLVLSVHSVVSWDFAMAIVPGWHSTIFAPYFVAGAIFSGVAMVITLAVPLRSAFNLQEYIDEYHLDKLGKLLLLTSLIVFYAYAVEFFIAWYSGSQFERAIFWDRAFGQYAWAGWIMYACNTLIPQALWFRRIRTSWFWMFVISIFVNIGMWFERFVIIIQSLAHEFIPYMWDYYSASWVEWGITVGSFAWFFMWFLLFVKFLPSMAIAELKELLPPKLKRQKEELQSGAVSGKGA
ncbi:MAG: NrfD/PsrC family molybdoenzyme membrane anchor subunit [Gemmatimonadota bacterium]|nr:NrfD/PsrC family molybdoenzyme membrane anchor subunit [Gemmatimonadota bacterium]